MAVEIKNQIEGAIANIEDWLRSPSPDPDDPLVKADIQLLIKYQPDSPLTIQAVETQTIPHIRGAVMEILKFHKTPVQPDILSENIVEELLEDSTTMNEDERACIQEIIRRANLKRAAQIEMFEKIRQVTPVPSGKVGDTIQKYPDLASALKDKKDEMDRLTTEMDDNKEQREKLTKQIQYNQERISKLNSDAQELIKQEADYKKAANAAGVDPSAKADLLDEARAAVNAAQAKKTEANALLNEIDDKTTGFKAQIANLEGEFKTNMKDKTAAAAEVPLIEEALTYQNGAPRHYKNSTQLMVAMQTYIDEQAGTKRSERAVINEVQGRIEQARRENYESIGVSTFDETLLKTLQRAQRNNPQLEALDIEKMAKNSKNGNAIKQMIYGIPESEGSALVDQNKIVAVNTLLTTLKRAKIEAGIYGGKQEKLKQEIRQIEALIQNLENIKNGKNGLIDAEVKRIMAADPKRNPTEVRLEVMDSCKESLQDVSMISDMEGLKEEEEEASKKAKKEGEAAAKIKAAEDKLAAETKKLERGERELDIKERKAALAEKTRGKLKKLLDWTRGKLGESYEKFKADKDSTERVATVSAGAFGAMMASFTPFGVFALAAASPWAWKKIKQDKENGWVVTKESLKWIYATPFKAASEIRNALKGALNKFRGNKGEDIVEKNEKPKKETSGDTNNVVPISDAKKFKRKPSQSQLESAANNTSAAAETELKAAS